MPSAKKLGRSKIYKTGGGNIFSVANCLETHGTECDNSAPFFSAHFAGRILYPPTFRATFKEEGRSIDVINVKKIIIYVNKRVY